MQNQNATILIVDDKPELCELLAGALRDSRLTVNTAATQTEALAIVSEHRPDMVIAELSPSNVSGLEILKTLSDIPAVLITPQDKQPILPDFAYSNSVKMLSKPLNLAMLKEAISSELNKIDHTNHATPIPLELKECCKELGEDYRKLSKQFRNQQTLLRYQAKMISAITDDDVFRCFFQMFVRQSGQVLGCALVCDSNAELKVTGRFGVPRPDSLAFCKMLSEPMIDSLLCNPVVQKIDAMDQFDLFSDSIKRYLPGITLLAIPLIPSPGEMIGMVILYRKGEQPFSPEDESLAQMLALPTALAVRRND